MPCKCGGIGVKNLRDAEALSSAYSGLAQAMEDLGDKAAEIAESLRDVCEYWDLTLGNIRRIQAESGKLAEPDSSDIN